jgi:hypothetical protein
MTEFWTQVEGEAVSPRYRLGARVERTEQGALYRSGDNAVVRLRYAGSAEADALLDRWSAIARLSHPHLARLLETGRCELAGERFVYAVTERAEETLAGVLNDRPLSPEETLEMLNPALDALSYIHQNGFVHGSFQPSNVLALGDTLKLSSENLLPAGEMPERRARTPYDAPEWDAGVPVPASDVWSLGVTMLQALTQNVRDYEDVARKVPQPFADVAGYALKPKPEERWTTRQIAARLQAAQAAAVQTPSAAKPGKHKLPLAAGGLALAGIAFFFFARKPEPAPVPVAPPVVQIAAPAPAPVIAPEPRTGSWYVVVATYNQRSGAEKRARETSRRWPHFKAQVFAPRGGRQHLVVIGSGLSQPEAEALRKKARAAGLPPDVFIVKIPG